MVQYPLSYVLKGRAVDPRYFLNVSLSLPSSLGLVSRGSWASMSLALVADCGLLFGFLCYGYSTALGRLLASVSRACLIAHLLISVVDGLRWEGLAAALGWSHALFAVISFLVLIPELEQVITTSRHVSQSSPAARSLPHVPSVSRHAGTSQGTLPLDDRRCSHQQDSLKANRARVWTMAHSAPRVRDGDAALSQSKRNVCG